MPTGRSKSYTYNPVGEATSFLNANGDAIGSTYNGDGLVTQETFADGTSYSYAYNAQGNVTSATDAKGNVETFVYGDSSNPYLPLPRSSTPMAPGSDSATTSSASAPRAWIRPASR